MTDMNEPVFLKPVFKQMIWGGNRMRNEYGYDIPGDDTGECWAISAHPNGDCVVDGGEFDGMHLSELYKTHPELFGDNKERFPLLVKIIDAKADLSIQVHPDDKYAFEHENGSYGKTECWYILDCDKDAEIIIGHNAKTKEELADMINNGRWDDLITPRPIKKGDFFQIEPGTVHAIKKGTLILETQQSSDVTYRLYDYGRLQNGKPRELHLKQSIDVITCPYVDRGTEHEVIIEVEDSKVEELVDCKFYKVYKCDCFGTLTFTDSTNYRLFSVIEGQGNLSVTGSEKKYELKKGMHFIIPKTCTDFVLSGEMSLIMSESKAS